MQTRKTLSVALLAIVAMLAACVTGDMPEGSTPEHFYYAAAADYVQAKRVALKYSEEIATPADHVEKILEIIDEVDPNLRAFEKIRRGDCAAPIVAERLPELGAVCALKTADFINAASGLRLASAGLRRYALESN